MAKLLSSLVWRKLARGNRSSGNRSSDGRGALDPPQQLPPNASAKTIPLAEHEQFLAKEKKNHNVTVQQLQEDIRKLKCLMRKHDTELSDSKDSDASPHKKKRGVDLDNTKMHEKWLSRHNKLKPFLKAIARAHQCAKHNECVTTNGRISKKGDNIPREPPERLKLLNGLNFQWVCIAHQPCSWDEHFDQLKCHKKEHGHLRLPQKLKTSPGLGNWVLEERRRCQEKHLNEKPKLVKPPLTPKEIALLEGIRFEWSLRNRGASTSNSQAQAHRQAQQQLAQQKAQAQAVANKNPLDFLCGKQAFLSSSVTNLHSF